MVERELYTNEEKRKEKRKKEKREKRNIYKEKQTSRGLGSFLRSSGLRRSRGRGFGRGGGRARGNRGGRFIIVFFIA